MQCVALLTVSPAAPPLVLITTVSTVQRGSCMKLFRAARRCTGEAPASVACCTPLASRAPPTSFSKRPQELNTTALAAGSAARMTAAGEEAAVGAVVVSWGWRAT